MISAPTLAATFVYAATMSLGIIAATTQCRFGRLHHVAFFFTCATTLFAAISAPSWPLIASLCCLATLPFCPSRYMRHRIVGGAGFVFVALALL